MKFVTLPRGKVLIYSYWWKTRNTFDAQFFLGRSFVMAFRGNLLVFFLLGIQRKISIAVTDRADGEIINIGIFFNASDRFLRSIVQNAKDNFLVNQRENNIQNGNLTFYDNPWWQDVTNSGRSQISLNDSLSDVWNISSKIQGAIFVDINSDSIFLSSLLERSGIPTIGVFQSSEQPRTQVRLGENKWIKNMLYNEQEQH